MELNNIIIQLNELALKRRKLLDDLWFKVDEGDRKLLDELWNLESEGDMLRRKFRHRRENN